MPASQPALLSLGADGVIRVWVEVTLAPALGTDARAGNPGALTLPASHYCCTLVIQVRILHSEAHCQAIACFGMIIPLLVSLPHIRE